MKYPRDRYPGDILFRLFKNLDWSGGDDGKLTGAFIIFQVDVRNQFNIVFLSFFIFAGNLNGILLFGFGIESLGFLKAAFFLQRSVDGIFGYSGYLS